MNAQCSRRDGPTPVAGRVHDGAGRVSDVDGLRARAEAFLIEVSAEYHAAHAGLKAGAALQPIYEKHRDAFGDEAWEGARHRLTRAAAGSEDERSARMLVDWLLESRVGRELAPLEEREFAWENAAVIKGNEGHEEPYQRAAITITNTRNASERRALDDARAALVLAELAPMRQERLEREKTLIEQAGIAPTYTATFERLSGLSLTSLRAECEQFLRDTQGMWDDVLPEFLKRGLGITPSEATRADALALMRAPEFDGAFPADAMEAAVRRQVTEMGISPDAEGRVRYDTAERPGKRARLLLPGAHPRRSAPRVASAWRAERLADAAARARPCAAFREHAARPAVRIPLARRQLGDRRVRDAVRPPDAGRQLARALFAAREVRPPALSARGGVRGAAVPAALLREAHL
jgi:hypothetical protein